MADKDIGSLVVIEDGKRVGMSIERHYARNVLLKYRHSPTTMIRDVMSTHIICASPERTIEECMAIMSERRIRHLPILDSDNLISIISIGDLIKSRIAVQEFIIEQLAH